MADVHAQSLVQRPTVMEVDLAAIAANFHTLRHFVEPAEVMPIVKANAYGHGLIEVARHLVDAGAKRLGVAFVEEGVELRQAGIDIPILVLGGIYSDQVRHFIEFDLELTASSIDKVRAIERTAKEMGRKARVHLKIDTGMERVGVHHCNAEAFFETTLLNPNCEIVGVYSHLAMTRRTDIATTQLQLERFLEAVSFFEKRSLPTPIRHLANTAGLLALPDCHLDMVRPGLGIYGVYPAEEYRDTLALQPAMTLKSRVVYFKVVPQGACVSYEWKWKAPRQTRIVTVPIGYGDGYFRQLTNRGSVLIRGNRYPIVGSVCMDQLMVDIGDGEAYNGDEVVLIGSQKGESISVGEIAALVDTAPHEVLVSTNLRVPRVHVT